MNKQLFKNFRFWILVTGIIFIVAVFIMKKFDFLCSSETLMPCEAKYIDNYYQLDCPSTIGPCENYLTWVFATLIYWLGLLLTFLGVILLFAEFIARLLTRKKNISELK